MKLVLDLLGPPRLMGARQRFEVRSGSLAIGRSPEADWVIPDASRLISRRHLRVDASHGNFVLTDTSANGVYVNDSDEPVGFGASVNLQNGDKLRVGEAEIAVSIESGETQVAPVSADAAASLHSATGPVRDDSLDGPFGATPKPYAQSKTQASLAVAAPQNGARYQAIDANWMNEAGLAPQPIKAHLPAASRPISNGAAIETLSILELADLCPDLTLRRLAAAVDEAGQTMEPATWIEFREKINQIMRRSGMQLS